MKISTTQEVLDELLLREFLKNHPQGVKESKSVAFYFTVCSCILGGGWLVGILGGN